MAESCKVVVGRHIGLLFEVGTAVGLTDGQLLDRIVVDRDEAAFTALIERHGPMVKRVCCDVLGDRHEAQDAFQATFLVLSRRAGSIRRRDSLASWLYGVALRVASCTRSASARRRKHERAWAALRAAEADRVEERGGGFEPLLHAELGRLPERFRAPVILCYLEGRTYEEAAELLRCPVGTIKSRLATARQRLRSRLERLDLAALVGPTGLPIHPATAPAAVSAQLMGVTIQAVMNNASGKSAATHVARLAQEVLKSMLLKRISAGVGGLIVSAMLATCAVELARAAMGSAPAVEAKAELAAAPPATGGPGRAAAEEPAPKPQAAVAVAEGVPMNLAGRVTDEHGRPVAGANVRLRLFRTGQRRLRIAAEVVDSWEVRTDAEGRYRVDGIRWNRGGKYEFLTMDANAPDFVESINLHFSDLPHATERKGDLPDIKLRRGVAVTGRCVGPDGKPVAGAKIRSAHAQEPESSLGRTRTTDPEGRFRFHIPVGREAELIVYSTGWAPRRAGIAAGGGDLGDIRLEAGAELTGYLGDSGEGFVGTGPAEGMTAIKYDPFSPPLTTRVIALESVDRGRFGWFPMTLACRTDRDGFFRIPALKGPFKIWAAPAHDDGTDDRGPIVSNGPAPAVLPRIMEFDPGSGDVRQPLILSPAPEVAIRGKITHPDGKPARSVSLWLVAEIGKGSRLTPLRWTTTDAEGRYELTGIPRGLTRAHLDVFAEPPDDRSFYRAVASGRFQGTGAVAALTFESIDQDQDPLDFRLELVNREPPPVPAAPSDEVKALIELGKEVERLQEAFTSTQDEHAGPARQLALYREYHPHNRLASRFLELAATYPDHSVAMSALGYVFQGAVGNGDPDAAISKAREQAIDLVIERHLVNRDVVFFFSGLAYGVPTPRGETLLRAALVRSPYREVEADACYELARFLQFKARIPDTLRMLKEKPRLDDPLAGQAIDLSLRNLERFGDVDAAKARAEAEQLLERVGRDFADVLQARFLIEGPGLVRFSRVAALGTETKTYGALAEAGLFELRCLGVGQPAPDFEGEDVDGRRFRLSDYRGQVVVLTFGGNWCGPCRGMYPQGRALVARLKDRPFAMLGVNTDPDRETLRKSIREGEINWRNWWDGQNGPITSRWNIRSFPSVFVIDSKGLIRDIGLQGAVLDRAVDRLLDEMARPGKD